MRHSQQFSYTTRFRGMQIEIEATVSPATLGRYVEEKRLFLLPDYRPPKAERQLADEIIHPSP